MIREIYDGENAHEKFLSDLDQALFEKVDYIIVEPNKVGDETSRWIMVGNCLHKTSVVSGLASVVSGENRISIVVTEIANLSSFLSRFCLAPQSCLLSFIRSCFLILHKLVHNILGH